MCQKPVRSARALGELRVVPVHRVARGPVPECGQVCGQAEARITDHARLCGSTDRAHVSLDDIGNRLLAAAQRNGQSVEDTTPPDAQRLVRQLLEGQVGRESARRPCQ